MARKPRADGTKFAVETAAELARPLPEPPIELSERGARHWERIIRSKRPDAWTDSDLFLAADLAEDYGELERARHLMKNQPPVIPVEGKKGRFVRHPLLVHIDALQPRILAKCRALHIHANATVGRVDHQTGKNQAARALAAAIEDADDDLIARPKLRAIG